jgi:transcriptional regulator with XRE-family HTH domain
MRKRLNFTIEDLRKKSGMSHNVIARLERNETRKTNPWVLGKILPLLADRFKETFPEAQGDPYDFLIPPISLGSWLRNQRLRRGMKQQKLAEALHVHAYSVIRYESDKTTPDSSVQIRLRALLGGGFERFLRTVSSERSSRFKPSNPGNA